MIICVLMVLFLHLIGSVYGNYTLTHDLEIRCKAHICRHGYVYENFYAIDINATKSDPDIRLEMHIAILAASNGHILLSTKPYPTKEDPVYELVVGGGSNKFTELRRNLKRNAKVSTRTIGILSAIELRAFYLILYSDGTIKFGEEGSENVTLEYFDSDPLPIEFFSFAAWQGVEAKFLYDCPVATEDDNEVEPDSKEVKRFQPISEQLLQTLLETKSPFTPPNEIMEISLGIGLMTTKYDVFESVLKTTLFLLSIWKDESMAWDPNKFNGTRELYIKPGQIWTPSFMSLNSAKSDGLKLLTTEQVIVSPDGTITHYIQVSVSTWCVDYKALESFNKWPRDQYTCNLIIVPLRPHDNYKMELIEDLITNLAHGPKVFREPIYNDWHVFGKVVVANHSTWNKLMALEDNSTSNKTDKLIITLKLTRDANAYNVIFYTPLLVLSLFVLISFWAEPLQMSRVWFHAGFAIFICLGLSFVDFLVPCHTLPSILVFYTCVLAGNLLSMCLIVLMMHPIAEPLFSSNFVQYILMNKTVRFIFCLEPIKHCNVYESVNESHYDDTEDLTSGRNTSDIDQMDREPTNKKTSKEEFGIIIDKIMFFIYSVVLAALLALHY